MTPHVATPSGIAWTMDHYCELGLAVVSQATRRVLIGEKVPNDEKILSIFEPHTELLQRRKAGKPIEFGHMILVEQVDSCFITNYKVFDHKPDESKLLEPILSSHTTFFGEPPEVVTASKGFYAGMSSIHDLEQIVDVVAAKRDDGIKRKPSARAQPNSKLLNDSGRESKGLSRS